MTYRFLTHFSTVSIAHLCLILMGGLFMTTEDAQKSLGLKVVSFKVAPGVHLGGGKVVAAPPRKDVRPLTKKMTKGTVMRPEMKQEEAPVDSVATNATETSGSGRAGDFPGVGGGSALGNALADLKTIYKTELRSRIEENKFYPVTARRLGQTGTVVIAFTLLEDGSITNIRIDSPSGNTRLDSAGLEAVKKVGKFKAIPSELGKGPLDMSVPIKFQTI